jgi:5-methylcytosine-specific restriction endonuclease McrA
MELRAMAVDDSITEKRCTKCGEVKPLIEFGRHRGRDHGHPSCIACNRERGRRWYAENREAKQAANKRYEEANAERMKAYRAAYFRERREKYNALSSAWYKAHPEINRAQALKDYYKHKEKRTKATRERWHQNKEKYTLTTKAWREANALHCRALSRSYKARKKAAPGSHTGEDVAAILKAQRGRCAACGTDVRDGFHVDHIQPLSKGGSNDKSNLQILCSFCNLSKKDKDPVEFARSRGLLL